MADLNTDIDDKETPDESNALEMSDDEFLKMDDPAEEQPGQESTDEPDDASKKEEPPAAPDTGTVAEESDKNDKGDTGDEPATTDQSDTGDAEADAFDMSGTDDTKDDTGDPDAKDKSDDKSKPPEDVNKTTGYDQLMAPFKANGEMMQVKSIDDARTLMKMGANYSKKMSGMAPHRKTLKLLDKHDLLEPEKLNYLIDLSNKNPEAIRKLLKDSKTDPLDIDLKSDDNYVPKQHTVSDAEINLDEVLEDIQDSQHYGATLNVISKEWDQTSRSIVSDNPQVIKVINDHMENGLYEQVANAVAYERRLGKLAGVSDFEAYKQMGDHMNANKLFKATQSQPAPQTPKPTQTEQTTQQPNTNAAAKDADRKARKAAASSSTSKSKATSDKAGYDPLSMSDEDFLKHESSNY